MPTLDDVVRIGAHLDDHPRDTQKSTICWTAVLINLQMIRLKGISVETWDASGCLFYDLSM